MAKAPVDPATVHAAAIARLNITMEALRSVIRPLEVVSLDIPEIIEKLEWLAETEAGSGVLDIANRLRRVAEKCDGKLEIVEAALQIGYGGTSHVPEPLVRGNQDMTPQRVTELLEKTLA